MRKLRGPEAPQRHDGSTPAEELVAEGREVKAMSPGL